MAAYCDCVSDGHQVPCIFATGSVSWLTQWYTKVVQAWHLFVTPAQKDVPSMQQEWCWTASDLPCFSSLHAVVLSCTALLPFHTKVNLYHSSLSARLFVF